MKRIADALKGGRGLLTQPPGVKVCMLADNIKRYQIEKGLSKEQLAWIPTMTS